MGAASAYAQADKAGAEALYTFEEIITGNIGMLAGLAILVIGLLTATVGGSPKSGLLMMLGGVLLTFAPGIFNGVYEILYGVIDQFSGGNPQTVRS